MRAQSSAAPRDYSFTIPTTQPWTDTGVDLETGTLEITASPRTATGCDPSGSGTATASANLPVAAAPAGALIAKLQDNGEALLVGANRQLKVSQAGHLYFGVNGPATPACSGSFAVKVHFAGGSGLPAASAGNALTSASSTSSSTPASASSKTAAPSDAGAQAKPAQDIKSKLASAAQVFLAGQFGTGAPPASSSA